MTDTSSWYEAEMRLRRSSRLHRRVSVIKATIGILLVVLWITALVYAVLKRPIEDEARVRANLIQVGAIVTPVQVSGQH